MSLMAKPTRRAVAIASLAFTAGIAGCGGSDTATSSVSQAQAAAQVQGTTPGQGAPGQGGQRGMGMDTAAVAKQLGVTEAKLTAALKQAMPTGAGAPGGTPPTGDRPQGTTPPQGAPQGTTPPQGGGGPPTGGGPDRSELYASLAKTLGLSETKVKQAFQAAMPQPPTGGQTPTTATDGGGA